MYACNVHTDIHLSNPEETLNEIKEGDSKVQFFPLILDF